ncbi:MAG: ECF-type sigma factor [Acidobacteriota bacterium]
MRAPSVTELLKEWHARDPAALPALVEAVYPELRRLARRHVRRVDGSATLAPTELVSEAMMRLMGVDVAWVNRRHFFAFASTVMRRVLIDRARARRKRAEALTLLGVPAIAGGRNVDLIDLDEALEALAAELPFEAKVVEMRFFGGLSIEDAAGELEVGHATVERAWRLARAWLLRFMTRRSRRGDEGESGAPSS